MPNDLMTQLRFAAQAAIDNPQNAFIGSRAGFTATPVPEPIKEAANA